ADRSGGDREAPTAGRCHRGAAHAADQTGGDSVGDRSRVTWEGGGTRAAGPGTLAGGDPRTSHGESAGDEDRSSGGARYEWVWSAQATNSEAAGPGSTWPAAEGQVLAAHVRRARDCRRYQGQAWG